MTTLVSQISKQQMQRAISELREFVAIPSLSNINNADYNRDNLNKAAGYRNFNGYFCKCLRYSAFQWLF